jgi:maltose/moltooligosaccharide transporter
MTPVTTAPAVTPSSSSATTYATGTLTYTRRGLFRLSLWLLWGDFAFCFFESVFGRFLPIYLKELNASNTLIGIMTGSFAGLVNVLFLPGISRWSDNFRSKIGRRVPFLYVVTPLVVGTLILVGFAPEIGGWIHDRYSIHLPDSFTRGGVILALLSLLTVSFHFFNMVLVNAYNWLIRDVVPLPVMARFLAWFRIVGTVSTVFFLWFVFPHLLTHRREICVVIGLFYLAAFWLMCRRVKEGDYPDPVTTEERPNVIRTYVTYFRECLQIPLYRRFFLVNLLVIAALNCAGNFTTLFVKDTLGVDMGNLGHIFSWTAALSAIICFPLGWLCDRISPMKVTLGAIIGLGAGSLCAYATINGQTGYLVYSLLITIPWLAWTLGSAATAMKLFPAAQFGQFSGALNVFGCGGMIFGNILIGLLMDWVNNDYRIAFLWTVLFCAISIIPMLLVIRSWKQHGGPDNYIAPQPE